METKYKYEIWMSGSLLHSDDGFEDEEEAKEEAKSYIESIIQDWKDEDAYEGETVDDFDIVTEDYQEKVDY